ncbi:MAG: hypothetical protein ACFFG0_18920 [Candidatus Thorarchaeota archaeon]
MAETTLIPHLPRAHKYHTKKCGCINPTDHRAIYCLQCGASYNRDEVYAFLFWECYDCGTRWHYNVV